MSTHDDIIKPKIGPAFILRNLPMMYEMRKHRNPENIENFLDTIKHSEKALYPSFEYVGKPVDVGMIYLMFNSEGKESVLDIDTVTRVWWIASKQARFHNFDYFIISKKLGNSHFREYYKEPIFNKSSKSDFDRGVSLDDFMFDIKGNWKDGYKYSFDFKHDGLNIKGDKLAYYALNPQSALIYANGRPYMGGHVNMKFYHLFGIKFNGDIYANERKIPISNGRGVIEHGIGIFGTNDLKSWKWLNLQFENGSMHLFNFPARTGGRDLNPGEAASVIDGKWRHYLANKGDFSIEETKWVYDKQVDYDLPIEWRVSGIDFDLDMVSVGKTSWKSRRSHIHYVSDHLVAVEGDIKGNHVKGMGSYEYLLNPANN